MGKYFHINLSQIQKTQRLIASKYQIFSDICNPEYRFGIIDENRIKDQA